MTNEYKRLLGLFACLGEAMESGTSDIVKEDSEKIYVGDEESRSYVTAQKFENEVDVVNNSIVIEKQPADVVHESLYPDVTRFSCDVQHGYRIFYELLADQYKSITRPFYEPVDAEGLGLWDYNTRIETPMSFQQIENKFKNYLYKSITEIISDMRLILENCYRYNGSDHWVSKLAQKLENILDQKLALLNRSLRDKVTLSATMAFRNNKESTPDIGELSFRRRRSGRSSYGKSDQTSRLVNQLILEKEETQKEIKRLKEKEKKEANEALMQELNEWENEIFTPDVLKELQSMWEIPSIGCFLWLFREALNLPELNFTEFENGFLIPHKSRQMASIFSVLLATPNQRKSFHKRLPMKFTVWEKKLKERMDLWYMTYENEEFQLVAHQIGLDNAFFEILGKSNPLEKKSYLDLSLYQRVLILKTLCDECLDYEPQLRDYLGSTETTPFREIILGNDEANWTYVYFPIFDATDVRIYKQAPLPSVAEWYRKWKTNSKAVSGHSKSGRHSQSKSRKSGSKSKELGTSIEGFELVCFDIETLRGLCERFSDQMATPSGTRRRGRPSRKRSEKELHDVVTSLLTDLGAAEGKYLKARSKGMLNLMKEWKAVEETNDSGEESVTQGEEDHDEVGEPPVESQVIPEVTVAREGANSGDPRHVLSHSGSSEINLANSEEDCSWLVTRSGQKTKKRTLDDQKNSTPNIISENDDNDVDSNEVPRIISLSKKLGTTNGVHTNDSETVYSPKTNFTSEKVNELWSGKPGEESGQELFPETVAASESSHSVAMVTKIPELEIGNDGNKQDYRGIEGTYGIIESSDDNKDVVCIEDTKEPNPLEGTNDVNEERGTHGNLEDKSMKFVRENDVNYGDSYDKQELLSEVTNIETCCKMENSMDMMDKEELGGNAVYQNGMCNKLGDICNGVQSVEDYEPSIKRHCSADNHIPMNLPTRAVNDGVSLETSQALADVEVLNHVTALEIKSVKSHKTMGLSMANELNGVSLETSHQSTVKETVVNDDVKNHVTKPMSSVGFSQKHF